MVFGGGLMAEMAMDKVRQGTAGKEVSARVAFRMHAKEFAGPDGCRPGNETWFVGPYGVPKENPLAKEKSGERKPAEKPAKPEGESPDMLERMERAFVA